jgi:hypothetical protein
MREYKKQAAASHCQQQNRAHARRESGAKNHLDKQKMGRSPSLVVFSKLDCSKTPEANQALNRDAGVNLCAINAARRVNNTLNSRRMQLQTTSFTRRCSDGGLRCRYFPA